MIRLLEVNNLKKFFPIKKGFFQNTVDYVKSVNGVTFHINEGETVGLVGESGSGKSTLGRAAIRLSEPTEGEIFFMGQNLLQTSGAALRILRTKAQIVFQDPSVSLNPRKTILENVGEALLVHKLVKTQKDQIAAVKQMMDKVGLPSSVLNQYPHQFSGGQQQRISLARALILKPKLIICDEITSALDLSVQAQVLNLLDDLKKIFKLSYLLISHDLSVVRYLCDRVLVMYQGKIVEQASTKEIFRNPQHAYTQKLLNSILSETSARSQFN